jgi:anti-sigma regulatory factor (Ser/Thr protein kinase)
VANIVLLTSELVTNAVVHPRGAADSTVGLRLTIYGDHVRVEVEDSGGGFDRVAPMAPNAERGRGLFLVDQFSDRWGSGRVQTETGPRFRVWFELDWREEQTEAVA